jgi:hypothetical protein
MISYNRFTNLIDELFLNPLHIRSIGYLPKWSTKIEHFQYLKSKSNSDDFQNGKCIWWHEEPLNEQDLEDLKFLAIHPSFTLRNPHCFDYGADVGNPGQTDNIHDVNFQIFANSEKSQLKKNWFKKYPYLDWYFFFHGFAALDWYRDFKYLNHQNIEISKVFICMNHIINNNRSYRLSLLSHLRSNNIEKYGFISAPNLSQHLIKSELYNPNSKLSSNMKKHIYYNLLPTANSMILDDCNDYNNASADIINEEYSLGSLWHLVTETVYYEEKLHLTEKIFKPIVSKRPFILVSSFGNLKYFRDYGFKTFDKWIDESYDSEPDPDKRLHMIVNELVKLCNLSKNELNDMYKEMQEVLEYNYNHFYGDFKKIIVDELIDNFKKCIFLYNRDLSERYQLPAYALNYEHIKNILMK